ncbi:RNA-guided endonuclease InsQ/TnpB family protein [Streptomyces litchfieldiae]|uniref:RNA-guided endonuclease TnpB family protein n=1 Tax=Streptomyces litchfieldiae TaxID=3075543 RepID=A0ABU2MNF3_9ACTN|nr:RNA-guided endonuclease TnpB family protein [Streptomyces sp. DSM 44938]MDT0342927.1 RNA-guided endonuclease TnpB family protein [Streptomyces sp. DSM 44938]
MQLRYQYRVTLTPGQRISAARVFGCRRVVWNDALARQKSVKASNKLLGNPKNRLAQGPYQYVPKNADLSRTLITQAKRTAERAFLTHCPVGVMQQTLRDLDAAWRAHEDSKTGKRKGPRVGPPRFKSKRDSRQSARYTRSDRFAILDNGRLRLPKIGDARVKWTRDLPSGPTSATLIKDRSGRYFVSFVVETDPANDALPPVDGDQGIDLGLTRFAVLADGSHIASPKYLRRAETKLKKRQRELSRKQKGSNNREKARLRVARAHARVADSRRNFHHQWSHKLTSENQAVFTETLNVRGLARTRLAKSVHDAGWAQFLMFCEYKAIRRGRSFAKVARNFPSSQTCSACGFRDGPKPLHVRTWTCPDCATRHDRDWNAGRNVRLEGRRILTAETTEPPTSGREARRR